MKAQVKVLLNDVDKLKRFIDINTSSDCDLTLTSGRYVINAKSLLGTLSLDLSQKIDLVIEGVDKDVELMQKKYEDLGIL